jgi:hypothetical protein
MKRRPDPVGPAASKWQHSANQVAGPTLNDLRGWMIQLLGRPAHEEGGNTFRILVECHDSCTLLPKSVALLASSGARTDCSQCSTAQCSTAF